MRLECCVHSIWQKERRDSCFILILCRNKNPFWLLMYHRKLGENRFENKIGFGFCALVSKKKSQSRSHKCTRSLLRAHTRLTFPLARTSCCSSSSRPPRNQNTAFRKGHFLVFSFLICVSFTNQSCESQWWIQPSVVDGEVQFGLSGCRIFFVVLGCNNLKSFTAASNKMDLLHGVLFVCVFFYVCECVCIPMVLYIHPDCIYDTYTSHWQCPPF